QRIRRPLSRYRDGPAQRRRPLAGPDQRGRRVGRLHRRPCRRARPSRHRPLPPLRPVHRRDVHRQHAEAPPRTRRQRRAGPADRPGRPAAGAALGAVRSVDADPRRPPRSHPGGARGVLPQSLRARLRLLRRPRFRADHQGAVPGARRQRRGAPLSDLGRAVEADPQLRVHSGVEDRAGLDRGARTGQGVFRPAHAARVAARRGVAAGRRRGRRCESLMADGGGFGEDWRRAVPRGGTATKQRVGPRGRVLQSRTWRIGGSKMNFHEKTHTTRRSVLRAGGALLATAAVPRLVRAAESHPPIGTYPAGSAGDSVYIGITVPRTGTYALQGEDELKGMQLAVEHINNGDPLIKKISPKTTKGVLGKQVKYVVADSEAKPNTAVQEQSRFISENKIVLMTGSTSSAVAVALNKLAQREKVLYAVAISGSNDTTGKDCVRYSFRQCFYGQTAAAALGPVMLKNFGKNKKAAYLTPDYTYGHTVQKSIEEYLAKNGGWTTATNQVAPLGAPDYSSYLLNVANSGADYLLNVNWGHDAVLSIQQAQQFGVFNKMKLVIPYQTPFLAKEVGAEVMQGVLAATDFWWTLEDRFPLAKM